VKGGLFNWHMFKVVPYSLYCVSGFFTFLGLFTLLTYIDISAVSVGIDPNFAFYLVAIANASSGLGRLLSGLTTDKFGSINLTAPMSLIAAAITFGWPYVTSKTGYILIAVFYGFCSGVYVSAFAIPLFSFGEMHDFGRRVGMGLTIVSFGILAGPPISGAINKKDGNFKGVGYFAGTMIVISVAFSLLVRQLVLKKLRGKF
jgi:MFS family permease